jgi:hypothetical protein
VLDLLHEPCDVESLAGKISWWIHVATWNPCDFSLWGLMKEHIFRENPTNLVQLRAAIINIFYVVRRTCVGKWWITRTFVLRRSYVKMVDILSMFCIDINMHTSVHVVIYFCKTLLSK